MKAVVFDGRGLASQTETLLKEKIAKLGFTPKLVSLFFKEDPASILYTALKEQAAEQVGVSFHGEEMSVLEPLESLVRKVRKFSKDQHIHGVMVQKPAKKELMEKVDVSKVGFEGWWERLVMEIYPGKDVDCLNPANLDLVYRGRWKIVPATVRAVLTILDYAMTRLDLDSRLVDRQVVVVGRSEIVGKPLAYVLAQRGMSISLCGSEGVVSQSLGSQMVEVRKPEDIASAVRVADVVVSATGNPGIITGEMVKEGVIVIDVGSPIGDVEFDSVVKEASFITPVPGGVGPVTVVSLLENLVELVTQA